jgi:hypothetical protein
VPGGLGRGEIVEDMGETRSTAGQDAATEGAVLRRLLALHPAPASFEELLREVAADPGDFAQRDAVERAVRELSASGLLNRSGELLLPSRAAVRADELLDD